MSKYLLKYKPYNSYLSSLVSEIISEEFFFLGWGEGMGRGVGIVPTKKKNTIVICLFFVLMLYIIFQVPDSSDSLFLTQTDGSNEQERHITLPMFYGIKSKVILTWILNYILNFRILSQAILYILC